MKKYIVVLFLIMCPALFAAQLNNNKPDYYTEDKPNIMVTKDQSEFTLRLKSNPTTGYSWYLREYNSRLIVPVKHSFEAPKQQLIGAPGYELWTFKVKSDAFIVPQQMIIRMVYARPFSSDPGSQIIFRISTQGK